VRIDAELSVHCRTNRLRDLAIRRGPCREDRVAAVEQRFHVGIAELGEQSPQIGHRDALGLADIDSAEQRDVSRHVAGMCGFARWAP
jgi:hypothetical protein